MPLLNQLLGLLPPREQEQEMRRKLLVLLRALAVGRRSPTPLQPPLLLKRSQMLQRLTATEHHCHF